MKVCYNILETAVSDDGQYIPTIVKEGVSGYYLTDWFWGKDIDKAMQFAQEKNEALGLTPEDVAKMVIASMRPFLDSSRSHK